MIRSLRAGDEAPVRALVAAAFDRPDEADLIERLRGDGDVLVELVAECAGAVIGHVMFSRLALSGCETAAALAPLAVTAGHRRQGVGADLVKAGVAACRILGVPAVVVLGDPSYYARFGFSAHAACRLTAPFSGPAFMALELAPGALRVEQIAVYASAFGLG